MRRKNICMFWMGAALALVFLTSPVAAEPVAGWKWLMTMTGADSGLPMAGPSALFSSKELGRYYVVDSGNNRLLSFDKQGAFLLSFNAGGELLVPYDMARQKNGVLWLVEKGRNTLTKIDLARKAIEPQELQDQGRKLVPDRLQLVGDRIYLLEKNSGELLVLNEQLQVRQRFSCPDCGGGFVDFKVKNGAIFALNQRENAVFRFGPDGRLTERIDLQDEISFPRSLAVDEAGNLYVLDRHAGEVVVFSRSGEFRYRFLSSGQAQGQVYYPIELLFDVWGRLCVVEEGNCRVQVFSRR